MSADGRYVVFGIHDTRRLRERKRPRLRRPLPPRPANQHHRAGQRVDGRHRAGTSTPSTPRSAPTGNAWCSPRRRPTSSARTRGAIQNVYVRDYARHGHHRARQPQLGGRPRRQHLPAGVHQRRRGRRRLLLRPPTTWTRAGPPSNDIFLHHLDTDTTEAVLPSGQTYPETQAQPVPNADGTVVAFVTRNDLLGTGASTREYADLHDRPRRRHDPRPRQPTTSWLETDPDISDDGRYVAYRTEQPEGRRNRRCLRVGPRGPDTTEVESVRSDGTAITTQPSRTSCPATAASSSSRPSRVRLPRRRAGHHDRRLVHDRAEPTDTASGNGTASTGSAGGPTYDDTLEATVSGSPGEVTITELETEDPEAGPIDGYVRARPAGAGHRRPGRPAGVPDLHLRRRRIRHAAATRSLATWTCSATARRCRTAPERPMRVRASRRGPCSPSGDWRFVAHSPAGERLGRRARPDAGTPDPHGQRAAHDHADPTGRRCDLPGGPERHGGVRVHRRRLRDRVVRRHPSQRVRPSTRAASAPSRSP